MDKNEENIIYTVSYLHIEIYLNVKNFSPKIREVIKRPHCVRDRAGPYVSQTGIHGRIGGRF